MGKTILVVDDSSIMRKMIKQTLIELVQGDYDVLKEFSARDNLIFRAHGRAGDGLLPDKRPGDPLA